MGKLHHINFTKSSGVSPFFSRSELQKLLNLYSRCVSNGEWRDYAIDQKNGMAIFSVFRHTHERPLFSIAKRDSGNEYIVYAGPQKLKRANTLEEALSVLEKRRSFSVIS